MRKVFLMIEVALHLSGRYSCKPCVVPERAIVDFIEPGDLVRCQEV